MAIVIDLLYTLTIFVVVCIYRKKAKPIAVGVIYYYTFPFSHYMPIIRVSGGLKVHFIFTTKVQKSLDICKYFTLKCQDILVKKCQYILARIFVISL